MIKDTAIGHYNLGVVQYQLQDLPKAIESFKRSLELAPVSTSTAETPAFYPPTPAQIVLADTHQNLGAAYILSTPPRPDLALSHLQEALEIMPDDGEVCFNLGAVLEATGEIEEALVAYRRARTLGIERASVNERNVSRSGWDAPVMAAPDRAHIFAVRLAPSYWASDGPRKRQKTCKSSRTRQQRQLQRMQPQTVPSHPVDRLQSYSHRLMAPRRL